MSALGQADICSAKRHVRFTPKADMCGATRHVRFVPEADMHRRKSRGFSKAKNPAAGPGSCSRVSTKSKSIVVMVPVLLTDHRHYLVSRTQSSRRYRAATPVIFCNLRYTHSGRWNAIPCVGSLFTYFVAMIVSGATRFSTHRSSALRRSSAASNGFGPFIPLPNAFAPGPPPQ